MGRKAKSIELSNEQRTALEFGYKHGSAIFSKRCHMILLKSEGLKSRDVSKMLLVDEVTVNSWLMKYEEKGIIGLETRPGQGRKPILDKQADEEKSNL